MILKMTICYSSVCTKHPGFNRKYSNNIASFYGLLTGNHFIQNKSVESAGVELANGAEVRN